MNVTHPGFADPVRDSQACFRAIWMRWPSLGVS